MPKTSLFETDLYLDKVYKKSKNNPSMTNYDFIKPGMIFTMHYEHNTRFFSKETDKVEYIIKAETVPVTVVSIGSIISECCCDSNMCDENEDLDSSELYINASDTYDDNEVLDNSGLYIYECVLQTEHPIFVCVGTAYYGRPITLCMDGITVATGHVTEFVDNTVKDGIIPSCS